MAKKHKAIRILDEVKTDFGWEIAVAVDEFTYAVKLPRDYYQKLTGDKIKPAKLVEASFKFLLDHEQPEQILTEFYLNQINIYFPDFETQIKHYL